MFLCVPALALTGSPLAPDRMHFLERLSSLPFSLPQSSLVKVLLLCFLLVSVPLSTSPLPIKTIRQDKTIRVGDFDVRKLWNWL